MKKERSQITRDEIKKRKKKYIYIYIYIFKSLSYIITFKLSVCMMIFGCIKLEIIRPIYLY